MGEQSPLFLKIAGRRAIARPFEDAPCFHHNHQQSGKQGAGYL